MRTSFVPVLMLVIVPSTLWAKIPEGGTATLTVVVTGLESSKGTVRVALFDKAKAFPTKREEATARQFVAVRKQTATVVFKDLAPGTYAVSAFHDVDGNGELNQWFFGMPKEPVGVSRDARGSMGPPDFKDARFEVKAPGTTITFKVRKP